MKLQNDFLGEVDVDNIRKFGDYNPRVFITTVAMLVGLDLRVARRIVLFDPIYSAEMEAIATGRICRTNQPAKEMFYYFLSPNAYFETFLNERMQNVPADHKTDYDLERYEKTYRGTV